MGVIIPQQYNALVVAAAKVIGIDPAVAGAQLADESSWDPHALSPTGAEGIAQFEPATWATWGNGGDPYNPSDAIPAYGRYMAALMKQFHGNLRDALAAYNAGPNNLAAGYGYADKIISQAGANNVTVPPSSSSLLGQIIQLPDQVTGLFTAMEKPMQSLAWFINPSNWARLLSGGLGVLLLIAGLVTLGLAV